MAGPWDHVERRDRSGRLVPRRRVLGRRGPARSFRKRDGSAVGAVLDGMADRLDRENSDRREREEQEVEE